MLNEEHLLLTSPQAMNEVLTTNVYDYAKPQQVRNFLTRTLGPGIILSEGEEHKVRSRPLVRPQSLKVFASFNESILCLHSHIAM